MKKGRRKSQNKGCYQPSPLLGDLGGGSSTGDTLKSCGESTSELHTPKAKKMEEYIQRLQLPIHQGLPTGSYLPHTFECVATSQ